MSSFSVCAENVLIHNFFESDRLNSKYLFWNDTPTKSVETLHFNALFVVAGTGLEPATSGL